MYIYLVEIKRKNKHNIGIKKVLKGIKKVLKSYKKVLKKFLKSSKK
jgi:hypothetical protein